MYRWIILFAVATTVPLLIIAILLLCLVLGNRVSTSAGESDIFYVDYDLSAILTISSWSATVGVLLPGFIMSIYSYVVASQVLQSSAHSPPKYNNLPTPHQFALSTAIMEFGGVGSLWRFLSSVMQKTAAPVPGYLKKAVTVLISAVLFAWLITAADTWLHASSSTILSYDLTAADPLSLQSYGRRMSPECAENPDARGCTINPSANTNFLMNDTVSIPTLMNISDVHKVHMIGNIAVLLSANLPADLDFITTTFGYEPNARLRAKSAGSKKNNAVIALTLIVLQPGSHWQTGHS